MRGMDGAAAPGPAAAPSVGDSAGLGCWWGFIFLLLLFFIIFRHSPRPVPGRTEAPGPGGGRENGAAGAEPTRPPGKSRPGCSRTEQPRRAPVRKKREIKRLKIYLYISQIYFKSNTDQKKKKKVPFRRV